MLVKALNTYESRAMMMSVALLAEEVPGASNLFSQARIRSALSRVVVSLPLSLSSPLLANRIFASRVIRPREL